jgi:hypothetical protein
VRLGQIARLSSSCKPREAICDEKSFTQRKTQKRDFICLNSNNGTRKKATWPMGALEFEIQYIK